MPGHNNPSTPAAPSVSRRRRWRRALVALTASIIVCTWVGCTSTVRPPTSPREPTEVFIIRNALHRGLVLPMAGTGYVEYSYGDWSWYAERNDAWYRVFPTVLWPTAGGLGRRVCQAKNGETLRAELAPAEVVSVVVEARAVERLRGRLRDTWEAALIAQGQAPVHSYGLDFVRIDGGYWLLNNCSDAVAGWLEQLECAVGWLPVRLDLEVAQ